MLEIIVSLRKINNNLTILDGSLSVKTTNQEIFTLSAENTYFYS